MNKKKRLVEVLLLILFFSLSLVSCERKELSKEEIIQIAVKAAKKEQLDLAWRTIIYDDGNKLWKEKIKHINKEMAPNYEFLKNKNYQAVCFALKEGLLGGDVWFFVDKATGEVLTLYGEK